MDDVLAQTPLQERFQRVQFGEAVHDECVLVSGIRRDLLQLGLVSILDAHRVHGDPSPTEVSRWVGNVVLGFTVRDDHCHLLDAQLFPASFLSDEHLLLGKFQSSSGFGAASSVGQDLDEIKQFGLVCEGVEEDLCCRLAVIHHDTHSDPVRGNMQTADERVQEGSHQVKVGASDASRFINDEDNIGDVSRCAIWK